MKTATRHEKTVIFSAQEIGTFSTILTNALEKNDELQKQYPDSKNLSDSLDLILELAKTMGYTWNRTNNYNKVI